MNVYLCKKIAVPFVSNLFCVSWMYNFGFIVAGGDEGQLKIIRLSNLTLKDKNSVGPSGTSAKEDISLNQNLEGHGSSNIILAVWNEVYQKLTTCDTNGLIIVWMNHGDNWYEEMINNRNKSIIVDMEWSHDGSKIVIVYEDGQVIVGSADGNRLWSKQFPVELAAVTWSGNDSFLVFGYYNGEVHSYDIEGNYIQKLTMIPIENVDLELALDKDLRKDKIVALNWYAPTSLPKNIENNSNGVTPQNLAKFNLPLNDVFRGIVPDYQPKLLIAYQHGIVQLMKNEEENLPIIVNIPNFVISCCKWSPDGKFFGIAGYQSDLIDNEKNILHIISCYGIKLRLLKVPGTNFSSFAFNGNGMKIVLAVDTILYFANIRPKYKWTYCGQTLVYYYENEIIGEDTIVFYETKMEEKFTKNVKELCHLVGYKDYCLIIEKVLGNTNGTFLCNFCNSIGTPLDFKYFEIEPKYVSINGSAVLIVSSDCFYLWYYTIPRKTNIYLGYQSTEHNTMDNNFRDNIYHIDGPSDGNENYQDIRKIMRSQFDCICSCTMTENFFLIGRESGSIHRYSFPEIKLQCIYKIDTTPEILSINCTEKRLAHVSCHGQLRFFDMTPTSVKEVLTGERKDVWGVKWDMAKEYSIAIMEKTRMFVINNREAEEPIQDEGYICTFQDLVVRTVMLDLLLKDPENPGNHFFNDIEIKSLRTVKKLLNMGKFSEATEYVDRNSHPKLWKILVEVALEKLDLTTAEHCFVMLKDNSGIQLLKRLKNIHSENLKKAEIAIFLGKLYDAEKIYLDNDRRDLAIDMRKKMNDWFRILQILQTSKCSGDDILLQQTWKHVGDHFLEKGQYNIAVKYYENGQNWGDYIKCCLLLDDFEKLKWVALQLNDGNGLLKELGSIFAGAGLSEEATECFVRCDALDEALDVCIQLNQWDKAVELSKKYQMRDIPSMLKKYASLISGNNDTTLAAVQLYRKAGKFCESVKIINEIAKKEVKNSAPPLRIKKLFVMCGLLIEEYREWNKSKIKGELDSKTNAEVSIQRLLEEDQSLSIEDIHIIEKAWSGAEAYHFMMLAHKQLLDYNYENALKTALVASTYTEYLNPLEVNCLLALAACMSKKFYIACKAFMKIDSLYDITDEEKDTFNKLATSIFVKNLPKDINVYTLACTNCDKTVPDYCLQCPHCDVKYNICIASGRPIINDTFWLCLKCKRKAWEEEIVNWDHCPLCHHIIEKNI
uniref:ANAPC4_WD40 domain-containing protein n=1 Tax=Strongyloides venezuelensis TaxID=75913 RepID=A0A0K0FYV2_STRVS